MGPSYPVVPHLLSCDHCGRSYGRFRANGFGTWGQGGEGPLTCNLPGPGEAIKRRNFGLKFCERAGFMQIYPKMSESENRVGLISMVLAYFGFCQRLRHFLPFYTKRDHPDHMHLDP